MVLAIYGAGGLGREVLILAQQINQMNQRWERLVFIDDMKNRDSLKKTDVLSFDGVKIQFDAENIEFVIAVGEPQGRRFLREKVINAGYSLAVLVHPSVSVPDDTKLGAGTIICCNCFISCDIVIGDNVLCQPGTSIGHDNVIGQDTVISTFVCVAGGCHIGSETYIGLNVPIKENITIGNNAIIGMGSVVVRDIPDGVIAIGNPARAVKNNIDNKVFHQ